MASSSSTPSRKYEVFLSFRGEDTRYTFVSHLHTALNQRGIITFFDELNLEKGQSISPELLNSIEESKFAIIVFSKNYASSTWCLDELVKIMECRSKYSQTVIPIFYDVDPSEVRKQKHSFAESFSEHEVNFKDNMEKVQIWKENLREAASILGHDLSQRNDSEASCINKIVEDIFSKLSRKSFTKRLVGMENHLQKLKSMLAEEPNDVCFVGIWGMGGIGKTTTAKSIFDELVDGFEGGCFLYDVYKHVMVDLQRKLLLKVLKSEINISDEDEGNTVISNRLCSKRVLLVLDGVTDIKQLESLAGGREWFGKGSRIIVTTRDKHLLNNVNMLYEITTLSDNEAVQLFSWHAFERNDHPDEKFVQLSNRVLSYAGGLPLALEVLGSYLSGRQKDVWESTLERLKDDPEKKIDLILKISFDGLNDTQQSIFLDIACFFRGGHKDSVIKRLNSFGFHPTDGIQVLQEKSLVHISDGRIQMHDLIQDMGQNIVRQKADKDPGRYSRLWDVEDIRDVLTNGTGTNKVEALVLRKAHNINLSEGAFRNMNRLRLLEVHYHVDLVISPNYLPNSLRWFSWCKYPGKSLPVNFRPTNLVSLNLSSSPTLETFPDISCMPNLEFLDLSYCKKLLEVHPSVGVHEKLVHLDLMGCYKIKKIPRTMQMKSLETLYLSGSRRIQSVPEFHSNMSSLRTLHLGCMGIKELPWSVGCLTGLQELKLFSCRNLRSLPNSLCGLKNLVSIRLSGCSNLRSFSSNPDDKAFHCFDTQPFSLKGKGEEYYDPSRMLTFLFSLPSLRTLHMWACNVSELILPESNSCLRSLEGLDLSSNNFVSLPESMNRFSSLQVLNLEFCRKLEALPELPPRIKKLNLDYCTALTRIPNLVDLLDKYKNLELLSLARCEQLFQKQDQFDSPQTNTLGQSVPQFLLALLDWGTAARNILCNRQEAVQVNLPCNYLFNWLHKSTGSQATVTLSPSCLYNDKLRGFVICAISCTLAFNVVTDDGLVTIIPYSHSYSFTSEHTAFFYIPIGKIIHGIERNEKKDYCLLEVANYSSHRKDHETTWGIGLVYEGEVDIDFSDLTVTNTPMINPNTVYDVRPRLKVCVTPRIQIQ